jgi:hypothetical protein
VQVADPVTSRRRSGDDPCYAPTLRALGVVSLSVLVLFDCSGGNAKPDAAGAGSGGSAIGGAGGSGADGGSGGAGTGGTIGSGGANVGGSRGTGGFGSGGTPDAAVDGPADAAETICAELAQLSLGGVLWREQPEGTNTWVESVPAAGGIVRLTIMLSNLGATTFVRYPTVTLTTPNSSAAFNPRPIVRFAVLAGQTTPIDWYVTFDSSLTTGTKIPFHAELSADQGALKCAGAAALDFSVTLR